VDELDKLPPIQWLIQDILPANNLVEVHGAPGAGKTQVVFDMAQTLAVSGQTVIYVVAEGLQGYRGRKRAWQRFHKLGSGNLFIWSQAVHLFDVASVQRFVQAIQPKKPALIVFDTLSRCSLGADENSQKDMNFILDALDSVRRETGATVVAVHHTNAAGLRERGSTVIRGGMDVMLEVSKDDELIVLSCSKMKDAADFEPIYLKPVLIDIGEQNPVPVLIPAEKRIQTQADKLTPLQLEILKAIGMEMFAESGIKSSQLDEILPPTTKRASKYHSLNTLIKLGYVKPHTKGDPYHITDEGRQKLSNAESCATSNKSKESKAGLSSFIWTLPEPGPMSSPVPHTSECGTDETLDIRQATQQNTESAHGPTTRSGASSTSPNISIGRVDESDSNPTSVPMTQEQLGQFAKRAGVAYPISNGADLYRICAMIPKSQRTAFECGLGNAVSAYYDELARQGQEPPEPPPDPVESFVRSGLVTAEELFAGYERARATGQAAGFLAALKQRNDKAAELLLAWINGKRAKGTVLVPKSV
jgi:hypothetical protein